MEWATLASRLHPIPSDLPAATLAGAAPRPGAVATLYRRGVVGSYAIQGRVAAGGCGVVLAARHRALGTRHALKLARDGRSSLDRILRREARLQSRIRSPRVVRLTDLLQVEGHTILVMDYVEGPTLGAWLRAHRPTPGRARRLFRRVVRAVRDAHRAGVAHLDIKPENVLLRAGPRGHRVLLADFGIAGQIGASYPLTGPTGSPGYMAPEQARGAIGVVSEQTDVFALGALLYTLLSGHPPFPGRTASTVLEATLQGRWLPLRAMCPRAPRDLAELAEACLARDPAARPAGCDALLRALDRVAGGLAQYPPAIRYAAPA